MIGADTFSINTDRPRVLQAVLSLIRDDCLMFDKQLYELEVAELKKSGPKSLRPSTSWWTAINGYYGDGGWNADVEALIRAHDAIWRRIGRSMDSGRFIPLEEVILPMSTFSGMPYLTRTDKVYQEILEDAHKILNSIMSGRAFEYYFSVLGHRGQSRGLFDLPKQRIIWQYPKAPVLVGLSWLQSVISILAANDEFVGWNNHMVIDTYVRKLLTLSHDVGSNVMSLDFSQFDSCILPGLVYPLFEKLRLSKQLMPILDEFFTSNIALPSGVETGRIRGVPSGHAWTNFVDSIANLTCIYYVAERTGRQVIGSTVLGDDSLVVYNTPIEIEEMSLIAAELGLKLNPVKSFASDVYCHYLQKVYFREHQSGGIRSIVRTLNSMISMEKWSSEVDPWFHVARWWMQLDEVRAHPARIKFLRWLATKDALKLGSGDLAAVEAKYSSTTFERESAWRGQGPLIPANFWFRSELI
jgi:hypothetical protein